MELRVTVPNLPPPTLSDCKVVGAPSSGAVTVLVGSGVSFGFTREGDGEEEVWVGGEALTASRGIAVSEAYLRAARDLAVEALRRTLTGEEGADDTVRCDECSRLLCHAQLKGAGTVKRVWCGPEHTVSFASGRSITLDGAGGFRWWD